MYHFICMRGDAFSGICGVRRPSLSGNSKEWEAYFIPPFYTNQLSAYGATTATYLHEKTRHEKTRHLGFSGNPPAPTFIYKGSLII